MDILHLVDRLEALLNEGRHPPLVKGVLLNEQRLWDIIDQMRIAIPEEVKRAKRINQERDRIVAQAHEESERILKQARERADDMISEHKLAQAAEDRASSFVERAEQEADLVKADADEYIMQVLSDLDINLTKTLSIVRNGLGKLQIERKKTANPSRDAADKNSPDSSNA